MKVKELKIVYRPLVSLMATGKKTGLIVDCGSASCVVIPVVEGFVLDHATTRLSFGGDSITDYLERLIQRSKGFQFISNSVSRKDIIQQIKEDSCFLEVGVEDPSHPVEHYVLPDGNILELKDERYRAPEILFDPPTAGYDERGLQHQILQAVRKSPIDNRKELLGNILLTGATVQFKNFDRRLLWELERLVPAGTNINISSAPVSQNLAWSGASALCSSTPSGSAFWMTKEQFFQHSKDDAIRLISGLN